jgi:hypothetical protein
LITTLDKMLRIDPNGVFPSRFMRPFRTPGGAALTMTAGTVSAEPTRETEVTLLRGDPDFLANVTSGTSANTSTRPLFVLDDSLMVSPGTAATTAITATSGTVAAAIPGTLTSNPAGATPDSFAISYPNPAPPPATVTASAACMDYNRNPYFSYQALQKLGNVVSNHSNVFAVWITVGYFEVSPVTVDAGHPDGYQLGQELGSDTGDIVRHRAFYMIDRSIPVGFIRGQDVNHDKAVLVKRYIE